MSRRRPEYLVVGRVGRPHGVRGELRVEVLTDFPERFAPGERLLIGHEGVAAPQPVIIVSARPHQGNLLVRFDLASDRDAAARLTNQLLYVPTGDAHRLPEGTHYAYELEGLEVMTADGRRLGTVREVLETGSADVLLVSDGPREVLIPMIATVIAAIDIEAGRVVVTPLPGLLEDDDKPLPGAG